jgi:hypothetical protein
MSKFPLRLLLAAIIIVLSVSAGSAIAKKSSVSPGCQTKACAKRVCKSAACKKRTTPKPVAREASLNGLASCIVHYESGGNPRAVNGIYGGIAQWSPEAWSRMGGTRFASTPTNATYAQQVQVLMDGLARFGCRDWCPFDPC